MAITQYGTTLTFQGNTSLASLGGGNLAISDDNAGRLYTDIGGTVTQIADTGFQPSDIQVLSDGAYLLYRQQYPNQTQGGAHYEVVNADGSVRVPDTDVASGTGHALGGPGATATPGGGFFIGFSDYNDTGTTHVTTAPSNGFTGYDPGVSPDVGYRYFTPAGGPPTTGYQGGPFAIANTGTFSNNGASGSDQAGSQTFEGATTLANGTVVTGYLNEVIIGKAGGGAQSVNAQTVRILSPSSNSGPIQVSQDPAPGDNTDNTLANAERGGGGMQIVSLGAAGFATIWSENSYTGTANNYTFNGSDTKIRYFDENGNALTDAATLIHRGTQFGNLPLYTAADALGDGRIALVYEDGTDGVNGTAASQLNVDIVGALGSSVDTTAITPAPISGVTQNFWSLKSLGSGHFAVGYVDTNEGSVVKTYAAPDIPCFCRGVRILTPKGEVPVENLKVGDRVATLKGEAQTITWIGTGRSLVTAINPHCRPVIVRRGALGAGVPKRDLRLTKGHSLLVDGALIPVDLLINDHTILWDEAAQVVEFFHVELATHEVLIADGAPAESFREDGNRILFHNSDAPLHAHAAPDWYAPVVSSGPVLDRAWTRLFARAGIALPPLTSDPDLHLCADGVRIDAERLAEGSYRFKLDHRPGDLRLASRVASPMALGLARDARRLGVAVRSVVFRAAGGARVVAWDADRLVEGWHEAESTEGFRWTAGAAALEVGLPVPDGQPIEIDIEIGCTARYLACDDGAPARLWA